MKKTILFLSLAIFIFLFALLISKLLPHGPRAEIRGHTFFIEVAMSPSQKEIGLAKYKRIDANQGMYFPFEKEGYYGFWMKGMHFPIDIIFIRDNKIVTIFRDVPVRSDYQKYIYTPTAPADSVLEINAGFSGKYGFERGDKVIIKY